MEQRTLTPDQALKFMNSTVDGMVMLSGFAEDGSLRSYARWRETTAPECAPEEVRDGRIPREIWKRIIAEGKIREVWAAHQVMLAGDTHPGGRPTVRLNGIRFDEPGTLDVARKHGGVVVPELGAAPREKPAPKKAVKPESEDGLPLWKMAEEAKATEPKAPASAKPGKRPKPTPDVNAATYTVEEAKALLQIGQTKFYDLCKKGDLITSKVGSRTVVDGDSVRRLLGRR